MPRPPDLATAAKRRSGRAEVALLAALYGVYELVRGVGGENWAAAREHTAEIVALEQRLGVFFEREVQAAAETVGAVPALLGLLYVALHFGGTAVALVWVHRCRPAAFAHLRTTLVVSTAVALVGYVLYPAAPPRLANLGFSDTVTAHTGLDLSSDLLGSLYNPIAAVPSLHFGYALAVGVALFRVLEARPLRLAAAAYPGLMLLVIVATGNHFFFDAAAGAVVVGAGWWVADRVAAPRRTPVRAAAPQDAWTPHGAATGARAA